MPSPSRHLPVRARRLSRELRGIRERTGLTVEQAAVRLGWSYSKLNRFELATGVPKPGDVEHMLDLYGVGDADRAALLQLARDARKRGWWAAYSDVFSGSYVGLEDEATVIRSWEPQLVPGLLQTPDYARAVIRTGLGEAAEEPEVQRRVQARMARQALLTRVPDAPALETVVAEAVLRQRVGGAEVMRGQMRALLDAAERSNIKIRVLPFDAGAHVGLGGAFVSLSFGPDDPNVFYVEGVAGETYVERSDDNDRVKVAFERITDAALSDEDSAALIAELSEEEDDHHVQSHP